MTIRHTYRARVATLACLAVLGLHQTPGALGQSSQPAHIGHEQAYARVSKRPLIAPHRLRPDGAVLPPQQKEQAAQADALYEEAVTLRENRDYPSAAARAGEAARLREQLFGPSHYTTISAAVMAATMKTTEQFGPDRKQALADADQHLREWEALQLDARYPEARRKAQAALAIAEEKLPTRHPLRAWGRLRLGTTLIELGEYDQALKALEEAAAEMRRIYGANHPSYADALDRLGWVNVYRAITGAAGRESAEPAVSALESAVAIYRATIGEARQTAESLDNLGTALMYVNRAADARDAKLRALYIRETVLGPEARDTGVSLSNTAWMYTQLGAPAESLPLRERALAIFRKNLRADHPYVRMEQSNLAWNLHLVGRHDDAITLYRELVDADRKSPTADDIEVAQRLARLGQLYAETGQAVQAAEVFDDVVSAAVALHAQEKAEQAIGLMNLISRAAHRARMYDKAAGLAAKSHEWTQRQAGVSDEERGLRAGFYGSLLVACGRNEEAKAVLSEAVERLRSADGEPGIRIVECLINLARAEAAIGEIKAAERHCDEAMQIAESKSGAHSPVTAFAKLWLGHVYIIAGHHAIAQFSLEESQSAFDAMRSRDPAGSVLARIERGKCLSAQSKKPEAVALLREALQISREVGGRADGAQVDALTAGALRGLVDAGTSGGATGEELAEWKREAVQLLAKLEASGQLTAEEKAWLKSNR